MYAIEIADRFSASHQLRLLDGAYEPLHEHLWQILLRVQSTQLDAIDTVMDFHELAAVLRKVISPLEGQNLRQTPLAHENLNPSAERIAEWIALQVQTMLPSGVTLAWLRISEAENCWAVYQP